MTTIDLSVKQRVFACVRTLRGIARETRSDGQNLLATQLDLIAAELEDAANLPA